MLICGSPALCGYARALGGRFHRHPSSELFDGACRRSGARSDGRLGIDAPSRRAAKFQQAVNKLWKTKFAVRGGHVKQMCLVGGADVQLMEHVAHCLESHARVKVAAGDLGFVPFESMRSIANI